MASLPLSNDPSPSLSPPTSVFNSPRGSPFKLEDEQAREREPVSPLSLNLPRGAARESGKCHRCQRELAVVILHARTRASGSTVGPSAVGFGVGDDGTGTGGPSSFQPHVIEITCLRCRKRDAGGIESPDDGTSHSGGVEHGIGDAMPELDQGELGDKAVVTANGVAIKKKSRGGRRKRGAATVGRDSPVWCEACSYCIGFGGVRALVEADDHESTEASDLNRGKDGAGWMEPDFGVEVVCITCVQDFDFCSNCGGGGTHRTGKWRCRQLFSHKRRNCNLQHTRLGDLGGDVQFITYECPSVSLPSQMNPPWDPNPTIELTTNQLIRNPFGSVAPADFLQRMFTDVLTLQREFLLTDLAHPGVMRRIPELWTWEMLNKRFVHLSNEIRSCLLGGGAEQTFVKEGKRCRRYVTLGFTTKALSRKKGSTGPTATQLQPPQQQVTQLFGFSLAEWYVDAGHVHIWRTHALGNDHSHLTGLCESNRRRIERDLRTSMGQMIAPVHVWCGVRRALDGLWDNQEMLHSRFGFTPLETYCKESGFREEDVLKLLRTDAVSMEFYKRNFAFWAVKWDDWGTGLANKNH
ncbi:hypothetical protein HK101_002718 [Irineochytrium annulatum]|nr:hypothetical protein HK101_002718 [Irineochytrium annulatum]